MICKRAMTLFPSNKNFIPPKQCGNLATSANPCTRTPLNNYPCMQAPAYQLVSNRYARPPVLQDNGSSVARLRVFLFPRPAISFIPHAFKLIVINWAPYRKLLAGLWQHWNKESQSWLAVGLVEGRVRRRLLRFPLLLDMVASVGVTRKSSIL